jgi:hypothetical protein
MGCISERIMWVSDILGLFCGCEMRVGDTGLASCER